MTWIANVLGAVFGGGRNVIAETAEVFRPNAENQAERDQEYQSAALAQFASEFAIERKGWFDRFIDGLNRLPRPIMALGTIGLFISAMYDPVWFANRMVGLATVPTELWALLGAIVTFYFGARWNNSRQSHEQSVMRSLAIAKSLAQPPETSDRNFSDLADEVDTK